MSLPARRPVNLLSLRLSPLTLSRPQVSPSRISSPTDLRILLNVTSPLPHPRRNARPPPLDLQPPTPPPKNPTTEESARFIVTPRTPGTPTTGMQTPRSARSLRSAPATPMGSHHLKSPKTPAATSLIRDSIRARKDKLSAVSSSKSAIGSAISASAVNSPTHIPSTKSNSVESTGFSYIFSHVQSSKQKDMVISNPVVRPAQPAPLLNLEQEEDAFVDPRSPGMPGRVAGVNPMGGLGMGMDMSGFPLGPETPFLRPPPSPWANAMI